MSRRMGKPTICINKRNFQPLTIFCDCTVRFVSDLVETKIVLVCSCTGSYNFDFRLCDKIDHGALLDLTVFFYNLAVNFGNVVQYNNVNRTMEVRLLLKVNGVHCLIFKASIMLL